MLWQSLQSPFDFCFLILRWLALCFCEESGISLFRWYLHADLPQERLPRGQVCWWPLSRNGNSPEGLFPRAFGSVDVGVAVLFTFGSSPLHGFGYGDRLMAPSNRPLAGKPLQFFLSFLPEFSGFFFIFIPLRDVSSGPASVAWPSFAGRRRLLRFFFSPCKFFL